MKPLYYFINKKLKITYIYDIQDRNFIKLKTPCRDCYLQTMCLDTIKPEYDLGSGTLARSCERLENYMNDCIYFEKLDKESQIAIAISYYERRIQ